MSAKPDAAGIATRLRCAAGQNGEGRLDGEGDPRERRARRQPRGQSQSELVGESRAAHVDRLTTPPVRGMELRAKLLVQELDHPEVVMQILNTANPVATAKLDLCTGPGHPAKPVHRLPLYFTERISVGANPVYAFPGEAGS